MADAIDENQVKSTVTPEIGQTIEWEPISGPVGAFMKRSLDLAVSLAMLILLSPLIVVVALLVKIDSRGSALFKQERVGYRNRDFLQWKFRSMVVGAESIGLGANVAENDDRITRIGAFLRKTSLDELPNLVNVLRGEMSLVGPRPTLRYQVERYSSEQIHRLRAKPGVTGLAAIRGRNSLSWSERIEYDIEYIEKWSFWRDVWIIVVTPWSMWSNRKAIYGEGGMNDDFGGVDLESSRTVEDDR